MANSQESNVLLVSKEAGQHLLAALQTGLLTTRAFGRLPKGEGKTFRLHKDKHL